MKTLQILGTGCAKCTRLADNVKAAAEALGIEYQMEKVTQIDRIMQMGVMFTPALAVDGVVKSTGRVLEVEQIKKLIA